MKARVHDPAARHAASADYYPEGNALRRAATALRRSGWRSFAWRLASECGYRRVLLLARSLTAAIPAPQLPPDVTVGELAPAEAPAYLATRTDLPADRVAERFAWGHRCFVARRGDAIVSSCWAATDHPWNAYLGRDVPLEPGDVYFYDAYTAAAARGAHLAPLVAALQLGTYRAAGYSRAVRTTEPENAPALRAHAKTGFVPIAMLVRVRIGPWRRHLRSPPPP